MSNADITGRLAQYIATARGRDLPDNVTEASKHRILDTLAAMVSGAHLKPGEMAIRYVRSQGGTEEASVLTTDRGWFRPDTAVEGDRMTVAQDGIAMTLTVPSGRIEARRAWQRTAAGERRRHGRSCVRASPPTGSTARRIAPSCAAWGSTTRRSRAQWSASSRRMAK